MHFLEVKHALQESDRDTLIEQSLALIQQSVKNAINQQLAKHNHDIESIILSIIGLIFEHCSKV